MGLPVRVIYRLYRRVLVCLRSKDQLGLMLCLLCKLEPAYQHSKGLLGQEHDRQCRLGLAYRRCVDQQEVRRPVMLQ